MSHNNSGGRKSIMNNKLAVLASVLGCGSLITMPMVAAAPEAVLTAQATPGKIVAAPGAKTTVKVRLTVRHEYHVNANPPSEAYLIPTTVTFAKAADVTMGKPLYPKGKPHTFDFSPQAITVYQDSVTVNVPLMVSAKAKLGSRQLAGSVKYQACNEKSCMAPTTAKFMVTLQIAKAGH